MKWKEGWENDPGNKVVYRLRHLGTDIQTRDNVKSDEEFFGDCPGSGPEPSCLLLLNLALNKPCADGAAARCFINFVFCQEHMTLVSVLTLILSGGREGGERRLFEGCAL